MTKLSIAGRRNTRRIAIHFIRPGAFEVPIAPRVEKELTRVNHK